jgi:hypothetical protein
VAAQWRGSRDGLPLDFSGSLSFGYGNRDRKIAERKLEYRNLPVLSRASCKTPSHEVLRHTIGLTEADFCF